MKPIETGIIPRKAAADMVDAYNQAQAMIKEAFGMIGEAEKILAAHFPSEYNSDFEVLDKNDYYVSKSTLVETIEMRLRKAAWKKLVEHLEIKKTMSNAAREKLEKQLDSNDALPITLENIVVIMQGMADNAPEYAREAILEAFETLTPGRNYYNEHKTNRREARKRVGKKVILTCMLQPNYGGGMRPSYHQAENKLMAIDKAFHLLDGKGMVDGYYGPLVSAMRDNGLGGETEYFKWVGYWNGNLHMTFLRPDLVSRLNEVAGGKYLLTD